MVIVLAILDAFIAAMLIWRRHDHVILSWTVVGCSLLILTAAPVSLLSSFALLLLFLCYTLLPLQLMHSLIAASLVTGTTLTVHIFRVHNLKQVRYCFTLPSSSSVLVPNIAMFCLPQTQMILFGSTAPLRTGKSCFSFRLLFWRIIS